MWSYATGDGRTLASGQPLDVGGAGTADILTLFSISWDGARWQVRPLVGPDMPVVADDNNRPIIGPACAPAQDLLQDSFALFTQVRYVAAANPADGCLAVASINPNTASSGSPSSPLPPAATAQFLARFGLLIPLDAAARSLEPHAPPPTDDERALAQQLAAYPGVICTLDGTGGC
jgi:hypothetical protein